MKKLINTFLRYEYLKEANLSHGNRNLIESCEISIKIVNKQERSTKTANFDLFYYY
jgi:hypothetical protein